jgi:hypothetical protein
MQNYNLPSANRNNTFEGVEFVLPAGDQFNLTGASAKLQVRRNPSTNLVADYKSPTTLLLTPPYTITLPPHIVTIPEGSYVWDLKIWFADGREKTYIGGKWDIKPVITR